MRTPMPDGFIQPESANKFAQILDALEPSTQSKKKSYKCKEGVVKFFQKAPQKEDAFRGGFTSESVCFDRLDDSFVQISSAFQFATNPFVISLRQKSALQALHSPQPVVAVLVADEALDILGAGLDRKRMADVQLRAVFIDDLAEAVERSNRI